MKESSSCCLTDFNKIKELSYMAGFFDGEGCISVGVYGNDYLSIVVNIAQNKIDPLLLFQKHFGGPIHKKMDKRYSFGPSHMYQVYTTVGKKVLEGLVPYLVLKKPQAILGLELMKIDLNKEPIREKEKWTIAKQIIELNCNRGKKRQSKILELYEEKFKFNNSGSERKREVV